MRTVSKNVVLILWMVIDDLEREVEEEEEWKSRRGREIKS